MWCVKCEQEVEEIVKGYHLIPIMNCAERVDFYLCSGDKGNLLVSCPTPENPDDWHQYNLSTKIPSQAERELASTRRITQDIINRVQKLLTDVSEEL